jgi:hypothetical protein
MATFAVLHVEKDDQVRRLGKHYLQIVGVQSRNKCSLGNVERKGVTPHPHTAHTAHTTEAGGRRPAINCKL